MLIPLSEDPYGRRKFWSTNSRVRYISRCTQTQWQAWVPESVNVWPATGTNCQSKLDWCKVSLRMPKVAALRTRLLGAIVALKGACSTRSEERRVGKEC